MQDDDQSQSSPFARMAEALAAMDAGLKKLQSAQPGGSALDVAINHIGHQEQADKLTEKIRAAVAGGRLHGHHGQGEANRKATEAEKAR